MDFLPEVLLSVLLICYSLIISWIHEVYLWTHSLLHGNVVQDADESFREGWLTVNGASSHVMTWGGWPEEALPEGDHILLFMCGVPGITLFYQAFLEALYHRMRVPVWTISIAGQELPPSSSRLKIPEDSKLYNTVEAQVAHKMAFIKEYVPKNRKIYFIGHSFGAKMVTELLKDEEVCAQMQKCQLLMPTLEKFGETPRARFWLRMIDSGLIYLLVLWIWLLASLPRRFREVFSRIYFHSRGLPHVHGCCLQAMVHFLHPTVFYNVRSLVWDELQTIRQLDAEVLTSQRDKIKVYFARKDDWAPLSHCESLRAAVPGLDVKVLEEKFNHAFTLANAFDMVDILVKDLKNEFH